MTTVDHTAGLKTLEEKIQALGPHDHQAARRCASSNDVAGLVGIANRAQGLPVGFKMRMGLALDLADYMVGSMPKLVAGRA